MHDDSSTVVCPACGAAVPKSAPACTYCSAPVVLPKPKGADGPAARRTFCTRCGTLYPSDSTKCPRCPAATEAASRGSRCPRCSGDLEPERMGNVVADRCRGCRGLWFDGEEIEHAIDLTTTGIASREAATMRTALPQWDKPLEEIRYLACVRCGERMARRQVAPRAGLLVDICRNHGVWFDQGEFEHFSAFVKAGGLEVMRHDGIASAEARARVAQASRPPSPDLTWGSPGTVWTSDGSWLPWAIRAVWRVLR